MLARSVVKPAGTVTARPDPLRRSSQRSGASTSHSLPKGVMLKFSVKADIDYLPRSKVTGCCGVSWCRLRPVAVVGVVSRDRVERLERKGRREHRLDAL